MQNTITIRFAKSSDASLIHTFVKELAEYEKLAHEVTADENTLAASLFGPRAYAEVLIAEVGDEPAGFCLFFHNFSTFVGKPGVYIEDLFVRPAHRGKGIGRRFFNDRGCGRIEWWVLDWNETAIRFYKSLGAKPMSEWTVYRVTSDRFKALRSIDSLGGNGEK